MTKEIHQLKHISSVSVLVFQNIATKEIAGKFVANYSDGGVCTAKAFFWRGKFSEDKHYELGFQTVRCGGSGYNKLHACLAASFKPHFDSYSEIADLDSGCLDKWFNSHGYSVTTIL